jgi:two-component system sensor histidine kinase SenX3
MDLIAAGAIGLAVGLALGALAIRVVIRRGRSRLLELERAVVRADRDAEADHRARDLLIEAIRRFPDGVIVCDAGGEEVFRNPAATAMGGNHLTDVLVLDTVTSMLESARVGVSQRRTLELFGPPRRTVAIHTLPIGNAQQVAGALALVEDVTERLRLEQARSDFVSNISHELRTPVGALALLAETLEGETDPADVARLSSRLASEAHRLGHVIEDLLELTRIEGGALRNQEHLLAARVVSECLERARSAADAKHIEIVVQDSPERVTFVGDRRQVLSALGNLVENAVRYSDPGSTVEVRISRSDDNAVFEVVDHGMGIPSSQLDRIFERFYRVDRARARETGGTGLGLSIVRHVVDNHRGSISVESVEGVGSTFTMRLPIGLAATSSYEEAG